MPSNPKEWKSYQDQIGILQSRGMIIDDAAEAEHCLKRIGYYRLSGYWYKFRQYDAQNKKALDTFKDGTKFSDIANLYNFDRKLRLLALDAIERIELAIQVEIAHCLGQKNPFAHLDDNYLHEHASRPRPNRKSRHNEWLDSYYNQVNNSKRNKFVEHNIQNYGGLAIWVAIEILSFGDISKLYAMMPIKDRIKIESQFGLTRGTEFETWLRGINFIRNTAAHHGRLWNCNVLELASVPRTKTQFFNLQNTRPFLYFCLMQSILKVICPTTNWKDDFISLMDEFPTPENNAINIDDMGVINDWQTWNIWK